MAGSVALAITLILAAKIEFASSNVRYSASGYQSSSTTPRHHIGDTYFYYMDSVDYCPDDKTKTIPFYSQNTDAYVKAWAYSRNTLKPQRICSYSFSSYGEEDLILNTERLEINNCSVKVHVYLASDISRQPDVSFS